MYNNYTYVKFRHDYGRQCQFTKTGPNLSVNLLPDPEQEKLWVPKNLVNKSTATKEIERTKHEVNATCGEYTERGVLHTEGGWPENMYLDNQERMVRFRKQTEKDESYLQAVLQMSSLAEHCINQNNAVDIYQQYYTDPSCREIRTLAPSFRTMAVMLDPCKPTRPVQHISWSPDEGTLLAVSYVNIGFQMTDLNSSADSFIFDVEDFTIPYFTAKSPHPIMKLEFNHRDAQCLAGGLMSGQVAIWDIRKSSANVAISEMRYSHRDPVKSLYWTNSKTNTEFYTGSSDGQVMWWDARKLSEPTEVLFLDLLNNKNVDELEWVKWTRSHGVTCMDYEPSIPIRFMIGTETGLVFMGNRKGKTVSEKISSTYDCHYGPVYSIQRNPTYLKNFMTVGDWQVRIWSEDIKESPIVWTKHHNVRLTDGAWSESKPSVFYTTRADGYLDGWDILEKQDDPILSIKLADKGLNCIRCHKDGALLAVGDDSGKTYIIKMNNRFINPGKNDKALVTDMFNRRTRQEKIIETIQRELKLKTKSSAKTYTTITKDKLDQLTVAEARAKEKLEKEFMKLVEKMDKQSLNYIDENTNKLEYKEEENTSTFQDQADDS